MNRGVSFAVLLSIGFVTCLLAALPASAQPPGSYQDTCRNIQVIGQSAAPNAALVADCRNLAGRWVRATLDSYKRCNGDIVNNDGRLACGTTPPPGYAGPSGRLPSGSWSDSCRNGVRRGSLMYAQCRTMRGDWRDASLDLGGCPNGPVGNNDGRLFCEGSGNVGGLPDGSWRDSCRNGSVRYGTLHAECRTLSGSWNRSYLVLQTCPRNGPVGNDNGRLFCEGAMSRARITLFQDFSLGGRAVTLTGPTPDLRVYNFSNTASSLRTQGVWYVCTNYNFSGDCTKTSGTINLSSKWNDRISSARPAE